MMFVLYGFADIKCGLLLMLPKFVRCTRFRMLSIFKVNTHYIHAYNNNPQLPVAHSATNTSQEGQECASIADKADRLRRTVVIEFCH